MSATDLPVVAPLPANLTAVDAFMRLQTLPHTVFFDSAMRERRLGRYSFVAADPFVWIERSVVDQDPLGEVERLLKQFETPGRSDLPPFQGGVAGLFGYELGRMPENIPAARYDDLPTPALAAGCYDVVLAFDHFDQCGYLISQGFPETSPTGRRARAERRADDFFARLAMAEPHAQPEKTCTAPCALAAPQFNVAPGVASNLSPADYRAMVRRAVEYIHAGDVFQVNLAQRLVAPARSTAVDLYLRLRERNPAPYGGYLNLGPCQIASASPECFLTVRDGKVETRPIKGTRGRSLRPEADLFAGDELQLSEKDRAENVMIVDLMRNDLSRVCRPESVHVAQLCQLETYAFVQHLVSVVRGTLQPGRTATDVLRASFPGGSVTGAPKVRAMQIIAELEPTSRGPYCGSLAYISFDGNMDASILIRTITAVGGWWSLAVGGGIVAQSEPEDEYRETWHKARGMLASIS